MPQQNINYKNPDSKKSAIVRPGKAVKVWG